VLAPAAEAPALLAARYQARLAVAAAEALGLRPWDPSRRQAEVAEAALPMRRSPVRVVAAVPVAVAVGLLWCRP
jgi:hypothetical protein